MGNEVGYEVILDKPFSDALVLLEGALKTEGFGILTRLDVQDLLKQKLNVDFRPFAILGACNPPLAYKAISGDPRTALMMPCKITVEAGPGDGSTIRFANPAMMIGFSEEAGKAVITEAASEVDNKIMKVVEALRGF
ncbi:MAG: DUF302 domain-containing protein [Anaerolineaceae bacterium]|nr:DUF302 domain-containing protein [Anaerolineaceae bacterium]